MAQSTRCDVFVDCKQGSQSDVALNHCHSPAMWGTWWCYDGVDDADKLQKFELLFVD